MANSGLPPDPHASRRRRAKWIVGGMALGYIPINLAGDRWWPSASKPVWLLYVGVMMVAWWCSLRIDWVRRDFQVRPPDPPRREKP